MDRRKQLKAQYREMKPDMGVFMIRSKANEKHYLEETQDLKSAINATKFKLKAGIHPHRELQQDWTRYGEDNFSIEILDQLEYAEDESKTDYSKDLQELRLLWEEKLAKQNITFY
ncbi:MAG: GIY-YIG nuclease family protein [Firmicutes bacterium]|nr:GIY-YIG nuclease family protein [Bacillota bacterium]